MTVYFYFELEEGGDTKSGAMDKVLLTFAIITPISVSIGMAFTRRERALHEIAKFRSFAFQVYLAHSVWDWVKKSGGRAKVENKDWLKHSDDLMGHLVAIGDELCRFLTLPTSSRGRHRFTFAGRKEAVKTLEVGFRLFDSLCTQHMIQITILTEELKTIGLSETECSRIRQYERWICDALENLRFIKSYRTPEALRTFARLFVIFLPPFYSPSFAQIAYNLDILSIGICFAVITSLALAALFESVEVLEDPFVGFVTLDGIDVREEFEVLHWQQLVNAREESFPQAPPFPSDPGKAIPSSLKHVRGVVEHLD
jgi:hypothetical protein